MTSKAPRAFRHHVGGTVLGRLEKFLLRGVGENIGRVKDATSTASHFLVAEAANLVDKLALPASGIDDMCVRVAEGRQHHAAVGIDYLVVASGEVAHRAESCDYAVVKAQPGIVDRSHARGHVGTA